MTLKSFEDLAKLFLSKAWAILAPTLEKIAEDEFDVVCQEALTVIPTIGETAAAGGDWTTLLDAAVQQTEKQLLVKGIQASTTALVTGTQLAFNSLNPDKIKITTVPAGQ